MAGAHCDAPLKVKLLNEDRSCEITFNLSPVFPGVYIISFCKRALMKGSNENYLVLFAFGELESPDHILVVHFRE